LKTKIGIIGAGIGGLTLALSLHEAGFEVEVFESVKEIKPLGVGINLLPHSVRVLTNLGLQDKIAASAVETSDLVYFNRFGQQFWSEPRGRFAGYKWPQFSVHRGELQMLLYAEVLKRLGESAIRKDFHFTKFIQESNGVTAYFISNETGQNHPSFTFDAIIGADGINSELRKQLYPSEGPPIYSENVLYRGSTRMVPFLNGSSMAMIGSLKQKMVIYPIEKTKPDGSTLMNWVANVKEGSSTLLARDWNRQADKQKLVGLYEKWNFNWFNVPDMIQRTEAVYEFPMSDRNPLERWSFGRVSLLGDAAHPMYPIGSNGASQAIIDADALSQSLLNYENVSEALIHYEKERLPATSKVVLQNRAKGPDEIMDLMENWFPEGFTPEQIPLEKLTEVMDNYKKIAGFDLQTLNLKN
jgi:5-methylphenazine-1-carboxylate 1-monooxygenase